MTSIKPLSFSRPTPKTMYGRYLVGPFAKGIGLNILNMLSVSLKADLSRVCITSVQFHEPIISHEYTSITGARENTLDLMMNLQNVVFVSSDYNEYSQPLMDNHIPIKGSLKFQGPGEIVAKDLKLPVALTCVDPNQHIATVDSSAKLHFDFFITGPSGLASFIPTAKNKNTLALNPKFNPIKQVNMFVDEEIIDGIPMETGVFEIWTDGSIHPFSAVSSSLSILATTFWALFKNSSKFQSDLDFQYNNQVAGNQAKERDSLLKRLRIKDAKTELARREELRNKAKYQERLKMKEEQMIDNMILDQIRRNQTGNLPVKAFRTTIVNRKQVNQKLRDQIRDQVREEEIKKIEELDKLARRIKSDKLVSQKHTNRRQKVYKLTKKSFLLNRLPMTRKSSKHFKPFPWQKLVDHKELKPSQKASIRRWALISWGETKSINDLAIPNACRRFLRNYSLYNVNDISRNLTTGQFRKQSAKLVWQVLGQPRIVLLLTAIKEIESTVLLRNAEIASQSKAIKSGQRIKDAVSNKKQTKTTSVLSNYQEISNDNLHTRPVIGVTTINNNSYEDVQRKTRRAQILDLESSRAKWLSPDFAIDKATKKVLISNGIETPLQLLDCDTDQLKSMKGIGPKRLDLLERVKDQFQTSKINFINSPWSID